MKSVYILGIANLLIIVSVYITHNYMFKIMQNKTKLNYREYSKLDMLLFVKFIGSFFWANIADRTGKHKAIICMCLLGFATFLSMFKYAPGCLKADGLNFFTYFYRCFSLFFLSGVFPSFDAFALEYLEFINDEKKWWARIKLFACTGVLISHLIVMFISSEFKEKSNDLQIFLTLVFAILTSFFYLFFL